jgi:hypothetical protein
MARSGVNSRRQVLRHAGGSTALRAAATVALVLLGYAYTHEWFARFDAVIAAHSLRALGFHVTPVGASGLAVHAGRQFNVTAIVTGSCSSAAGVLGLLAVTLVLLPGNSVRRGIGGVVAAALFVACNQLRIVSIVLVGWWLASSSRPHVLATLTALALVALLGVVLPHRFLALRVAASLFSGLCAILAFDVWRGSNYLDGMISYHALAGPILTLATLALGILVLWRAILGREEVKLLARRL